MESDPMLLPGTAQESLKTDQARSPEQSISRWSKDQPDEAVARLLESKIRRIGGLHEQLGEEHRDRKDLIAVLTERIRIKHPDGVVIDGIFYRLHADGRGLDRMRLPVPELPTHG